MEISKSQIVIHPCQTVSWTEHHQPTPHLMTPNLDFDENAKPNQRWSERQPAKNDQDILKNARWPILSQIVKSSPISKKNLKKHPDISPSVPLAISSLFCAILCSRFNILFHFRFPVVFVYSCFQIVHTVSPNKNKNQYSRFYAIKLYVECFEAFIYHLSFLKLATISRDSLGLSDRESR